MWCYILEKEKQTISIVNYVRRGYNNNNKSMVLKYLFYSERIQTE